jgi:MMP 1-O-methyltransferase
VTPKQIVDTVKIPTWLSPEEKLKLAELAIEFDKTGSKIVEVGSLYGGSTALLALGAPHAIVVTHDDFSWSPEGYGQASASKVKENLRWLGITNVVIVEGDSRITASGWKDPIDLLWIDGGHSVEFVLSDLNNLGPHAKVIALHDYGNPSWTTISDAVEIFLRTHPEFTNNEVTGWIAVLRRK